MPKVFWLECPECRKTFYADYNDFYGKKLMLRCPWCHKEFRQEESARVIA